MNDDAGNIEIYRLTGAVAERMNLELLESFRTTEEQPLEHPLIAGDEDAAVPEMGNLWLGSQSRARQWLFRRVKYYAGLYLGASDATPHYLGWVNVYGPGQGIKRHDHGITTVVCTYYPQGGGAVIFDHSVGRVETPTGALVLFPGDTAHWSEKNEGDEARVCVVTNVQVGSVDFTDALYL